MRIVHYCARMDLSHGGVVRAVLDACALLARAGHEVTLLAHDTRDVPRAWLAGGGDAVPAAVAIDPPDRPLGLYGRRALARVAGHLDGADVLHLHTPWERANVQLARAAAGRGLPYVITVHGMLDDWSMAQHGGRKRLYLAVAGRRLLERAAFVHCTATAEEAQARRWYPRGRGIVIPLVFDVEPFRALPGPARAAGRVPALAGETPAILFLSRLHYKKGPDLMLEAAARFRADGVPFHLVMAGDGEDDYVRGLERHCRALGLDGCATFTGLVSGDEKLSIYERADVFVLPTSQENFGMVFPEAMACGTPVVTTRGVDIWPELEASGGGVIVERRAEAVAAAVATLLADPDRRRSMGAAGRRWVFETLTAERVLPRMEAMYREAAAPGSVEPEGERVDERSGPATA